MPFWSGDRLVEELPNIIEPFNVDQIDCAAYTMTIGSEIYITPHESAFDPETNTKRQLGDEESFAIPAGQFAYLLTEETVKIPRHVLGFISVKATIKWKGMINVSGFHVDPGYEGRLIFSVFNAGPSPVHLQHGQQLFLLWLADLDQESSEDYSRSKDGFTDIPTGMIIPGEIHSLQSLSKQMKEQEERLKDKIHEIEKMQSKHNLIFWLLTTITVGFIIGVLLLFAGPAVNKYFEKVFYTEEQINTSGVSRGKTAVIYLTPQDHDGYCVRALRRNRDHARDDRGGAGRIGGV